MSATPATPALQPLAVAIEQAAELVCVSPNHFRTRVLPHVPTIRIGSSVRIPIAGLQRWVEENASVQVELDSENEARSRSENARKPRRFRNPGKPVAEPSSDRVARFDAMASSDEGAAS